MESITVSGSIEDLFATLETTVSDDMQSPRSLKSPLLLFKIAKLAIKIEVNLPQLYH